MYGYIFCSNFSLKKCDKCDKYDQASDGGHFSPSYSINKV